jgi:hypothetical protein
MRGFYVKVLMKLFQKFQSFSFSLLLRVNAIHVTHKFNQFTAIAPLIIVPAYKLHEVGFAIAFVVEGDACASVEEACAGLTKEVGGNYGVFCVADDAFEFAFGGFFHSGFNFVVGGGGL